MYRERGVSRPQQTNSSVPLSKTPQTPHSIEDTRDVSPLEKTVTEDRCEVGERHRAAIRTQVVGETVQNAVGNALKSVLSLGNHRRFREARKWTR